MHGRLLLTLPLWWSLCAAAATGPSPEPVEGPAALRTTPAAGIAIPATDRSALQKGSEALSREIDALRVRATAEGQIRALLPDVEIFHKAVDWALRYDEFYRSNEVGLARTLLEQGRKRAQHLAQGDPFWLTATGLVVRGYRSRIDDSVQPYGLVVPSSFAASTNRPHRLDVWLHGRDEHLTELKFLSDRLKSYGEFTPPDTFVLHPYGRFCNAFKFAGETDVFEALEHAKKSYPIDDRRLGLRGFSMGGAGVWHLAAHHPTVWAAAAPGAGFAETAEYTGALKKEPKPSWWVQKLWKLYDATEYAANFHNLPVIAYSGEIDKQKQAADVMARAMKAQGLELEHLIGPGVAHKYEPGAKKELARRFDALLEKGRDPAPTNVVFSSPTLSYPRFAWGRIASIEKPWERAHVTATVTNGNTLSFVTTNVAVLQLDLDRSLLGPSQRSAVTVLMDGSRFELGLVPNWTSVNPLFFKATNGWRMTGSDARFGWEAPPFGKRPGLQGPIDDAFLTKFVVVRPMGPAFSAQAGAWFDAELARFTNEWRAQFRGDVRVVDATDEAVTKSNAHLILWGDPASNPILAKLLPRFPVQQPSLPLQWNGKEIRLGTNRFDATTHVPVLIFPNPFNPSRYVVLNSGPTYFDFGAASNAQQTPKLPDFAVIDITVPRAERLTKGVALAGFFDERWRLPDAPQP